MKIVILDMDDLKNPHWGSGQAKVTREIGKHLSKDHQIVVYSSKYPGYKDYKADGVEYKHIGLGSNFSKLNNIFFVISSPFYAANIKADVLIENFTAPFSVSLVPLFARLPVVGSPSFFASKDLAEKYKLPFDVVTRVLIKLYKYSIAFNSVQEKELIDLNPKLKTRLVFNGADDNYFNIKTSEQNYLLFIGRIDINHKGLDILLNAFRKIKNKVEDKLYVVGSGTAEDETKLKQLISQYDLSDKVQFLGKKNGEDKVNLLKNAKIIVAPSRYESMSLTALEAISLGKPVVCFDIPGFDWLDDKACMKVAPFDVDQYAQALKKYLTDGSERKRIGLEARKVAKTFSWKNSANQLEKFLYEVIN